MTIRPRLAALLLLLLACAACKKGEEAPPAARQESQQEFRQELTGEALFNERCRDCHAVGDKGGAVGPALTHVGSERDRAFLERVIREPGKVYPGTVMPPYGTFSKKQIDSLVDYLRGLK